MLRKIILTQISPPPPPILAPPTIQLPPQYEQGLIFDTDELIRLRVPYVGRPHPNAVWYQNGKEVRAGYQFLAQESKIIKKFIPSNENHFRESSEV